MNSSLAARLHLVVRVDGVGRVLQQTPAHAAAEAERVEVTGHSLNQELWLWSSILCDLYLGAGDAKVAAPALDVFSTKMVTTGHKVVLTIQSTSAMPPTQACGKRSWS